MHKNISNKQFIHTLSKDKYIHAATYNESYFINFLKQPTLENLLKYYKPWIDFLLTRAVYKNNNTFIDGFYFDCIPRNLLIQSEKIYFIDPEWRSNEILEMKYLIFRCVINDLNSIIYWIKKNIDQEIKIINLIKKIFVSNKMKINNSELNDYILQETKFIQEVTVLNNSKYFETYDVIPSTATDVTELQYQGSLM